MTPTSVVLTTWSAWAVAEKHQLDKVVNLIFKLIKQTGSAYETV